MVYQENYKPYSDRVGGCSYNFDWDFKRRKHRLKISLCGWSFLFDGNSTYIKQQIENMEEVLKRVLKWVKKSICRSRDSVGKCSYNLSWNFCKRKYSLEISLDYQLIPLDGDSITIEARLNEMKEVLKKVLELIENCELISIL